MSDGSAVDVISNSISYVATEVESSYSIIPSELLEQLKTEFDQVNLFSSSGLADEIHIRVIENGETDFEPTVDKTFVFVLLAVITELL